MDLKVIQQRFDFSPTVYAMVGITHFGLIHLHVNMMYVCGKGVIETKKVFLWRCIFAYSKMKGLFIHHKNVNLFFIDFANRDFFGWKRFYLFI